MGDFIAACEPKPSRFRCRVGVDVGGTNTDAALVALGVNEGVADSKRGNSLKVVASCKNPTTEDVTTGICDAIRNVLEKAKVPPADVLSVNVGTTHFINAVTQRDATKLRRVAVLRLCGPFARAVPPFSDWPLELKGLLEGPVGYLSGGLELDGRHIAEVSEEEVLRHANIIRNSGVTAVVVAGVFSNLDTSSPTQEEFVKRLIVDQIPGIDVVCSKDVGNAPYIERENAAILNASILEFGRRTISSFENAFRSLQLDCALYLTQNDGTVMDTATAARTPIRTFSSGATNSLTGAMFLSGIHSGNRTIDPKASQVIMCDIGGTTSDFAALAPSGFPRQSPATVKVGGVRTAFRLPEVVSIGLGGGSRVIEHEDARVTVGPESVGYQLPTLAKCFGGNVLTATDVVVASGSATDAIGTTKVDLSDEVIAKAQRNIKRQLERNIDTMRVSDQEVILLLVGGGSIIQMDKIDNVKECIRPPFFNVANAVGAAIAKISGEVDQIEILGDSRPEDVVERLKLKAIEVAASNGAVENTIKIVEVDSIPIQYTSAPGIRVVIRACGELSWDQAARPDIIADFDDSSCRKTQSLVAAKVEESPGLQISQTDIDFSTYEPEVLKATGEWFVSEIDLAFIAEGCGILGTGGGGSVYTTYLHSMKILKSLPKGRMRIVDASTVAERSRVGIAAFVGSPSVSNERLCGDDEWTYALKNLLEYLKLDKFSALASGEIGGANGMTPFPVAAMIDTPILDGDMLGRAFPKVDMCLPLVYGADTAVPAVISDPRGNTQVITQVESANRFERLLRCLCIEMGLSCALAFSFSAESIKRYTCHHSVSLCWYIGRAVFLARQQRRDVVQSLINTIPGCKAIFTGRIIQISREVTGGWTVGRVTIEYANEDDEEDTWQHVNAEPMVIQFQNEFLYAALRSPDGSLSPVCTTPDLITVLDTAGTALGTHELRYGLMVTVIAMPAHPLWKAEQGMKASDPKSFGFSMDYAEFGEKWEELPSVIATYGK